MADQVAAWIERAATYASAEKRFVDDLVAANPGVVDLEMGLPAGDGSQDDRAAPRMDVAIIQTGRDKSVELAFWEAKFSTNSGVRARTAIVETEKGWAGPAVVRQLATYKRWINTAQRADEVRTAYKETVSLLETMYSAFGSVRAETPECLRLWQALAQANLEGIGVVYGPGLVIGNYCPDGHTARDPDAFGRYAATFHANGHRTRLMGHGTVVHEVGPELSDRKLPRLQSM